METVLRIMPQLGDLLHSHGHISKTTLDNALARQKKEGGKLGDTLIGEGAVGFQPLYETLAFQQGLPFINLQKSPADSALFDPALRETYRSLQALPYARDGNGVTLVTTDPQNPALHSFATEHYGKKVRYVMTSPFDIRWMLQTAFAERDNRAAIDDLWRHHPEYSARDLFATSYREKIGTFLFVALIAGAAVHYSTFSIASTFLLVNLFYLCALLFKLLLVSVGRHNHPKRYATDQLDERSLPLYTILIPLYREERTLPKLLASIRALDYPKHKLDVKLIVEADDPETFAALKALKPERYFDIIRVPASEPRTKPKACNYAMRFAKGEYVTIYDAEDEPEPGQLKQAVLAFRHGDERLVCVQARLNYHNRFTKFLPGCFALEYSLWFDFMLPGLAAMGMPIPLGGTSNHFKMEALKELEYWDPFNVTEDADLGVRLLWKGYRVGLIDSITWEESPVRLYAWIRQRSRWIKGYMQTYFVHMRKPLGLCKQLGIPGFFGFQMFIGAPTLMYLINPLMIAVSLLIAFFGTEPFSPLPNWLIVFAVINLLGGILLQISFGLISALHHRWWRLILHACLSPLYFLLHSAASLKALAQLITRPHYWEKTEHGVG